MDTFKPVNLYARMRSVWQRGQLLSLLMGLGALYSWVIILFLAAFAVDLLVHLSAVSRSAVLAVLVSVSVYRAWQGGWRYFSRYDPTRAALQIENHYKGHESLFVTGVQLHRGELSAGTSASMTEVTVKKADKAAVELKAEDVVGFKKLRQPAVLGSVVSAVIIGLAVLSGPLLAAGAARIFTPWQQVVYPTRTQIELEEKAIVVKEGDSVRIGAKLSGQVPENAKLAIRTGEGKPRVRVLKVAGDLCEYSMAAAFRSFDYSISAGDASSDWHTVKVVPSPRIEKTQIRLEYPEYMRRSGETVEAMTLTVPEGCGIEWNLQMDRAVSSASVVIDGGEPVELEVSEDGLSLGHKMQAGASCAYSLSWVEKEHGFGFESPKYYLQVAPDKAPDIEMTWPKKNLYATVGRKLPLAFRVRDDHGVADSRIVFRHNNELEGFVSFTAEHTEGRSVQHVDWDYRSVLEDLDIGESVTFSIEVSDFYPGSDGPHKVRSQSRRVTFLSKEDYLAKITAQKERLLSQLRGIYRQERSAYDVIKKLDPSGDAFEQTCFLESSRQDMLSERIMKLNGNIQELVDDLAANNITEKSEFDGLNKLQVSLKVISDELISQAGLQLRELAHSESRKIEDVADSAETVNRAGRELGSLVLQLGVRQAMEVFARELHVIAQMQSGLRLETLNASGDNAELSKGQKELEKWLGRLLIELGENRNYRKIPLAIVRLTRMVKDIRNAGIDRLMIEAAGLLADGKTVEAVDLQDEIIQKIFQFECFVRVGAEYDALLKGRELFTSSIDRLKQMRVDNDSMTAEQFNESRALLADALSGMYTDLRLLIIPVMPAPEPGLLDEKPTEIPLVDQLTDSAEKALLDAAGDIAAGKREESFASQKKAEKFLGQLNSIVERRIEEKSKTARYAGFAGEAELQSSIIRELLSSQLRLVEKTEDADYDKTSAAYLAPSQKHLSKEVDSIKRRLIRNSKNESAAKLVGPMLKLLDRAEEGMLNASPALEKNDIDKALEYQDVVLDSLEQAIGLSGRESAGWIGLANLLITTEAASLPVKYMGDVVAQQGELIGETKNSTPEMRGKLADKQNILCRAVTDISLLLDTAGSSIDFEQAMTFAASDMGASALHLKSGKIDAAMESQGFASDALKDLSKQLKESEGQYYYFVNVLEFLQDIYTDASVMHIELTRLRGELENTEASDFTAYAERMEQIEKQVQTVDGLLYRAIGRKEYSKPHENLAAALKELKAGELDGCIEEAVTAEDSLRANLEELRELIVHIGIIPDVVPAEAPPEYTVMMNMVTTLVEVKELSAGVYGAKADELSGFESKLSGIVEDCNDLINETRQHGFVIEAEKSMSKALELLMKSSGDEAYKELYHADTKLRHCILEYALYYIEPPRRSGSMKRKKGRSTDVSIFKLSLKIKPAYDKDWGGVEGDDPKSGRTDWEVLGDRDRAALNENFVRELPLEYREILKDYYERLTQ